MNGTLKKEIYGVYSREGDMTFIMEDTYDADGDLMSTECVGWYHGEPDDESTATFKGKLKAEYLLGREKDEPRADAEPTEGKKSTFKVVYEYSDGLKGICKEEGKPRVFDTEQEAAAYAEDLNGRLDHADMRCIFPVYRAEKA